MRERELKLAVHIRIFFVSLSLPMRERELKQPSWRTSNGSIRSLPMRERELKPPCADMVFGDDGRSPCGSAN